MEVGDRPAADHCQLRRCAAGALVFVIGPGPAGVAGEPVNRPLRQGLAERVGLAGVPAGVLTGLVVVAVERVERLGD